jgi:uracil-DNA glycosylase
MNKKTIDLVQRIQAEQQAKVPAPDPAVDYSRAQVLFVLRDPGPGAIETMAIGPDANDQTAKNLTRELKEARLPRDTVACWNIRPWITKNPKHMPAADVKAGRKYLLDLVKLMPAVKIIVLAGNHAQ